MSLNSSAVASAMNTFYETQKADINDPGPNSGSGTDQVPFVNDPVPPDEWVLKHQDVYFADAQAGTPSQPSVLIADGAHHGLLYFDVLNDVVTASNKAQSISNYWQAKLTFGTPILCGGTIVSITNDAAKIKAPIEAYLLSGGAVAQDPPYAHEYAFIESQVKTIIWTVTELDGKDCVVPTDYTVTVT